MGSGICSHQSYLISWKHKPFYRSETFPSSWSMWSGPTVDLVSNRLVACYGLTCDIYQEGSWEHLQNTTARRQRHNSATTEDAVLLIGGGFGGFSKSTELIPVDGSPSQPGSFTVRHGESHCTSQLSDGLFVVTGGQTGGWAIVSLALVSRKFALFDDKYCIL